MCNYRGPFTESIGLLKRIRLFLSKPVFADDAESTGEPEGKEQEKEADSTVNIEDLLSSVRKQEKEKHYKTIDKLKAQVGTLSKQHNTDLLKITELESKVAEAEEKLSKAGEGDSSAVLAVKEELAKVQAEKKELEDKLKEFEAEAPPSREEIEKEVREELTKEFEVRTYKAEKLAELKDEILVPELVMGDSKEEIDKSIEAAKKRSEEIRKSLGINKQGPNPKRKQNPSSPDVSGMHDSQVDLESLSTMDVSSKEYAELRKKLGLS